MSQSPPSSGQPLNPPPDAVRSPASSLVSASSSASAPVPTGRRQRVLGILLTLMLSVGLACAAWWFWVLRHEESTDDAYVAGNVVRVMPQVSGRVLEVLADDTDPVRAGQALLRLDSDDARLALEYARVELAVAVRDICRLQAQWRESMAQVEAAWVTWEQATANLQRREVLGRENAVRVEELHNYRAQVKNDAAQLEAARQRQQALEAQLLADRSSLTVQEHPRVRQAAVNVRQRWLALVRCEVQSPVDGQVAQRAAQPGAMVTAGSMLMAVIPLQSLWVDANFKEVQLRRMRIGQSASVTVDMHGTSVVYAGKVAGFAAGTGSAFALIPPQNATGNWIKIVQRVPVRIELDPATLREHPLLVGLSSVVTVDTRDQSGPLLTSTPRQRPLPASLHVPDPNPDPTPVEEDIVRIIDDNMLTGS